MVPNEPVIGMCELRLVHEGKPVTEWYAGTLHTGGKWYVAFDQPEEGFTATEYDLRVPDLAGAKISRHLLYADGAPLSVREGSSIVEMQGSIVFIEGCEASGFEWQIPCGLMAVALGISLAINFILFWILIL